MSATQFLKYAAARLDPTTAALVLEPLEFKMGVTWVHFEGCNLVDDSGLQPSGRLSDVTAVRLRLQPRVSTGVEVATMLPKIFVSNKVS